MGGRVQRLDLAVEVEPPERRQRRLVLAAFEDAGGPVLRVRDARDLRRHYLAAAGSGQKLGFCHLVGQRHKLP